MKSSHFLLDKNFIWFIVKFLLIFGVAYFGTLAVIGLSADEGYYSPFVGKHLDYVSGIKHSLLYGIKFMLSLFGIQTQIEPAFTIRIINGRGVIIAMDCVGYGVYSFWLAYVAANSGTFTKKVLWILGGLFLLWFINLTRICLFLVAINKNRSMPLGIDHHTWFNIVAYGAIFAMMYFFERSLKRTTQQSGSAI